MSGDGLVLEGTVVARDGFASGPVDLAVPSGTAAVVLGPSGAGKSTFLRGLAGFLPIIAGSARLDGDPLEGRPPERRRVGYVPSDLGLFPHRRVRANVGFARELRGGAASDPEVTALLERFGLDPLTDRYPSEISTGERQRVAVARALAADPHLLLWDEPLAAVDVLARDHLLDLVRTVLDAAAVPLLLVTHDPETAISVADRAIVLDAGRPSFQGPFEGIARNPRDPFTARFFGYANVLERPRLEAAARRSALAGALLARAGPLGIALRPTALEVGDPGYDATVRRVLPMPEGIRVWVDAGGLELEMEGPSSGGLRRGGTVKVRWGTEGVRALGGAG